MESVLISIAPHWCEMIASGKKTIEIRKTAPKIKTPFKCYIYETMGFARVGNENLNCVVGGDGRGRVIGEFVCDYTKTLFLDSDLRYGIDHPNEYGDWIAKTSGVSLPDILDYFREKDGVYWHISKLRIYDGSKTLENFRRPCANDYWCESCAMRRERGGCGNAALCITRPPQSWCYAVENT